MKIYLECQGPDSFLFTKLEIFVCDLQTRLIEIECETYDTIDAVHEKLYDQEGVPTLLTRLAQKNRGSNIHLDRSTRVAQPCSHAP